MGGGIVPVPGRCCLLSNKNETLIPHSSLKGRISIYPLRLSTIISCYHFSAAKLNQITTELNSATPGKSHLNYLLLMFVGSMEITLDACLNNYKRLMLSDTGLLSMGQPVPGQHYWPLVCILDLYICIQIRLTLS